MINDNLLIGISWIHVIKTFIINELFFNLKIIMKKIFLRNN